MATNVATVAPETKAPGATKSDAPEGQTTIYALAEQLFDISEGPVIVRRSGYTPHRVTEGLELEDAPKQTKMLHYLTPGQVASLNVNLLWVSDGQISGFQRPLDGTVARRMAAALVQGKVFPPILVGLDHTGRLWVIDGDHRAVAGIIARKLTPAVIFGPMTMEEMAVIFNDQSKAKRLTREHHIMLGQTPAEKYIRAVEYDESHPWYNLAAYKGARNLMTLTTAHELTLTYATGRTYRGRKAVADSLNQRDWDETKATELAALLAPVLGSRTDEGKRKAWESGTLRALSIVAKKAVRDHGSRAADIRRFQEHMATFPFQKYVHLHRQAEWEQVLTKHWNKRLREAQRLEVPVITS